MEYGTSETDRDLRRDEFRDSEVGRKDFMFGATGVVLMIVVAILFALFS
jgi:hypothetical protein